MDVGASLVADGETAEAVESGQGSPANLKAAGPRDEQAMEPQIGALAGGLPVPARAAHRHTPPVPQVIYAERRPRLSGPEILAKYSTTATVSSPRAVRPIQPDQRQSVGLGSSLPRMAWWSTLALVTLTQSAGLPLT
jgi:hypothetical protein